IALGAPTPPSLRTASAAPFLPHWPEGCNLPQYSVCVLQGIRMATSIEINLQRCEVVLNRWVFGSLNRFTSNGESATVAPSAWALMHCRRGRLESAHLNEG